MRAKRKGKYSFYINVKREIIVHDQKPKRGLPIVLQKDEKFKYVLSVKQLDNASNEHLVDLKKQGWIYVIHNSDGKQFDTDTHRKTTVNKQPLKPDQIQGYAKQYPLINKYVLVHTQTPMCFFYNAITKNIDKAKFVKGTFHILFKNDSTNVEITQSSACLETDNDMLFIMNPQNPTPSKSYSIPGSIQTVVEMTGQYNLQILRAGEDIPADKEIRENPNKLYLYLNKSGLLEYAVCGKINGVERILVKDDELGESNALLIKKNLEMPSSKQKFDDEAFIEALYAFFKITSKAGFPIAGLKLKAIKASNKVLLDLMVSDYQEFNAEILEKLIKDAKEEESRESLYQWYKNQAKIFFSKKFFMMYDHMLEFGCDDFRQKFLIEVNQFLLHQYEGDTSKFRQFLLEFYQEELVSRKNMDEGIESLYGWYKDMAKFFFSEAFVSCCSGMLDCYDFRKKFLLDVSLFLSKNYDKPQNIYQEFILDTGIPEFLSREDEPNSLFGEIISGFEKLLNIEEPLPQKPVRSLPLPEYGLHSTIECSVKYKFILNLYLCIKNKSDHRELPSPVPEVSLKEDGSLSITIHEDDKKFTSAFKAYNEGLFNQHFKSCGNGKFIAIFKDENTLKQFLLVCNMMEFNINIALPKLYKELRKEENKSKSDSKKVMNIETRSQPFIHSTPNFVSQQSAISAEIKDKFPQKQQIPHGSHKITPSRSLPLPKNNSNVITTPNSAFEQQSASADSTELKDKFSQVKPEQKNPFISHHAMPSRSLPVAQNSKQSIVPNTNAINTQPQQSPVSIEFKNQLSQNILDTQGPKIGNEQHNYQTKLSDAKLLNTVRSYSSPNLLAVCTASTYPEIDIFAKVIYSVFTGQKYQYGALPQITLNAESGCFCITYNSHKPKEFKNPDDLKECFSQLDGFEKVNIEKLCQELCLKQNINYEDISKKWESPKSFLSNFDFF